MSSEISRLYEFGSFRLDAGGSYAYARWQTCSSRPEDVRPARPDGGRAKAGFYRNQS